MGLTASREYRLLAAEDSHLHPVPVVHFPHPADIGTAVDDDPEIFDRLESNVRSYCRSFPATFDRAKGCYLYDTDGQAYLDFLAGAGALNYGHNHDVIKAALVRYVMADGVTHGLDLHTGAKAAFLGTFEERVLAPRGLEYKVQFTGPTGTNAVEAALKLARKATGRPGVFAFMGGYHGHSLGALAATANAEHRAAAGVPLGNVTFFPFPSGTMAEMDTLAYLKAVLTDTHSGVELPAAVIVETVQAEGGVNVAPDAWLVGLREICDTYAIVLIVDDIQTGCGRTGPFFSFEPAGIIPDMVTLSKSISGYGLPMSLVLIRPELDVWKPAEHTGTFRGNQLAFVAATAALEVFDAEGLEAATAAKGEAVRAHLERDVLVLDERIELRGRGLIWGLDLGGIDPTGALTKRVSERCFADHLIVERTGRQDTVLKVLPPLIISDDDLDHGLHTLSTRSGVALSSPPTDARQGSDVPPLARELRKTWDMDRRSFHMPGHKGGAGASPLAVELLGAAAFRADVSEVGGFDYLHAPVGGVAESQRRATSIFGAGRSYHLVNGATAGNIAALTAVAGDGDRVLISRGSHRSVYAGLVVSGAVPAYLPPVRNTELDAVLGVEPEDVERALAADPRIRAVHITSPDYYGFTAPTARIAEIAHAHDAVLIVDEAHGSHFAFHEGLPTSAMAAGADLAVQSPHKTLGSLTQSSLLHLAGDRVVVERLEGVLQMLQSSSPSALLLISLDLAIAAMAEAGAHDRWSRAIALAQSARARVNHHGALRILGTEVVGTGGIAGLDPLKLTIDVSGAGMSGFEAAGRLRAEYGLNPEFADLRRVVCSVTLADDEATIDGLVAACEGLILAGGREPACRPLSSWLSVVPEAVLTPRRASQCESARVPVADVVGQVVAEMVMPYPPGIPLLVPGERITAELLEALDQLRQGGCRIVGQADASGATFRCVTSKPARNRTIGRRRGHPATDRRSTADSLSDNLRRTSGSR